MDHYPPLEQRELPPPPHWRKALGVGVVVAGLAIGTGELILWPHLTAKHGLDILWLALLGFLAQFVINREVARNVLATGEGFFTASARVLKGFVYFWLIGAILIYVWPGWASALGTMLAELFGVGESIYWSWVAFGLVLLMTFSGKTAYITLERAMKITVPVFFILLVAVSWANLSLANIYEALQGVFSFGFIPEGIDINVLLGGVVFAGAGGMLNLAISLWYRDKQAGMSKYAGRISNPITGREEAVSVSGFTFDTQNETNLKRWRGWMRYATLDQGVIFFGIGFLTLLLLSVNAYFVLSPLGIVPEGNTVAITQAEIFGSTWGVLGVKLFLAMASLMLFSVMWAIIDALSRIISDIVHTNSKIGPYQGVFRVFSDISMGHLYYGLIGIVVLLGVALLPFRAPLTLLVVSGVLSGISMAIYTPLLLYINNFRLDKALRPSWITNLALVLVSIFFVYFSYRIVFDAVIRLLP